MSKKEIIEKIMKEYSKYGLSRIVVEISYLMAILWRIPKDSIYPGMRNVFNNAYGIQDDTPAIDAGKALWNSVVDETKEENPDVTDSDIVNGIEYVGINTFEESLEDIDFMFLDKVKQSMIQSAKGFVKSNT